MPTIKEMIPVEILDSYVNQIIVLLANNIALRHVFVIFEITTKPTASGKAIDTVGVRRLDDGAETTLKGNQEVHYIGQVEGFKKKGGRGAKPSEVRAAHSKFKKADTVSESSSQS